MPSISPTALAARRRARLRVLLDLARITNGWSRQSLAQRLGRDPTKLVPASGNPKLDLVVAIAGALGWDPGDVVGDLWATPGEEVSGTPGDLADPGGDLRRHARLALEERRWDEARAAASALRRQVEVLQPCERALADEVEAAAWSGAGCHATALSVARRGLSGGALPFGGRLALSLRMARSNYELWHLVEARAIASDLLSDLRGRTVEAPLVRRAVATAHAVRGHASRRLIAADPGSRTRHVRQACEDLAIAEREFLELHEEFGDAADLGASHLHRGGALEARATGDGRIAHAVEAIIDGLEHATDLESLDSDASIEAHGWWCVFGCNLALRGLEGEVRERSLAILTNKAFEIADRIDQWSIRERAFTFEHFRRQRIDDTAEPAAEAWVLDEEDLGHVLGTMGRFPAFRPVGWRILESSGLVED
ncbi:MAG: hypothetical protein ACYTFH_04230 [Planctomycetota bacterium]